MSLALQSWSTSLTGLRRPCSSGPTRRLTPLSATSRQASSARARSAKTNTVGLLWLPAPAMCCTASPTWMTPCTLKPGFFLLAICWTASNFSASAWLGALLDTRTTRDSRPKSPAVSALATRMLASSRAVGCAWAAQSLRTLSPPGPVARWKELTASAQAARRITWVAGRMTSAGVCEAPDTMPSALPRCTIMVPNQMGSVSSSFRAPASAPPRPPRITLRTRAISARSLALRGSRNAARDTSAPICAACSRNLSGSPSRVREQASKASSCAAAASTRGSSPSGSTRCLGRPPPPRASSAARLADSSSSVRAEEGSFFDCEATEMVCRAMLSSSSVGMTRILEGDDVVEISTPLCEPSRFLSTSSSNPNLCRPLHTMRRILGLFWPMPAVKTRASTLPSSRSRNAPTYLRTLSTNILSARTAIGSPWMAARSTSRMSL
mmetsp:Transcript_74756/g.200358  ORF Transcript_74756/g.200358 Transcript_74756/m.200358 type:complete len:438 (+) Transcript_74756:403-1716(+)